MRLDTGVGSKNTGGGRLWAKTVAGGKEIQRRRPLGPNAIANLPVERRSTP